MNYFIPQQGLTHKFSWLIGALLSIALISMSLIGNVLPPPDKINDACISTSNQQLSASTYVLIFTLGNFGLCCLSILAIFAQGTRASNAQKLTVMVSEIIVLMFNITVGFALVAALSSQSAECREVQSDAFYWFAVCIAAIALIIPAAYITLPIVKKVFIN